MRFNSSPLSQFDGNRTNNFTTIRILLAWCVLYGHSFSIHYDKNVTVPLNWLFKGSTWIGAVAVHGFFVISGFLVAASFINRGLRDYVISRALRILPALTVCVFLIVFILGPIYTSLELSQYFQTGFTYTYLWNALAWPQFQGKLPGVFQDITHEFVNGSLWTISGEVRCYALLAILGTIGFFKKRWVSNVGLLLILLIGIYSFSDLPLIGIKERWARPSLYFLIGVFFYVNRDKILIDARLAVLAAVLLYFSFGQPWYTYLFPLPFCYLVFYVAYASPFLNTDKYLGDISYGLYIYAWPVQQMVCSYNLDFTAVQNTIYSTIFTVILAYASWHWIEKPALNLKSKFMAYRLSDLLPSHFTAHDKRLPNSITSSLKAAVQKVRR